ncbi:uncharacterized protein [Musca autumnalis]|uniref:uncharacterized protein n=1 Tax=Musca autumnalis TaxID=221902 RepID=UPI003CF2C706
MLPPKKLESSGTIEMIENSYCYVWKIKREHYAADVAVSPEILAHIDLTDSGGTIGITSKWRMLVNWKRRAIYVVLDHVNIKSRLQFSVMIFNKDHAVAEVDMSSVKCEKFIKAGNIDIVGYDSMEFSFDLKIKHNIKRPIEFHNPCKKMKLQTDSNISIDFGKLLASAEYSDIILVARGGIELKAHKLILRTRSEVFAAMLSCDFLENQTNRITIDDIDADVLKEMLKYMYTGEDDNIPEEMASDLLMVADKYALMDLQERCEYILICSINIDTVIDTLLLAERMSNKRLKERATEFIKANLWSVRQRENWKQLKRTEPYLCLEIVGLD